VFVDGRHGAVREGVAERIEPGFDPVIGARSFRWGPWSNRSSGTRLILARSYVDVMAPVPEPFHDLFEKRTIAHVTTMLPSDQPHAVPVWIDYDAADERLLINTERHTRKVRNVADDPRVAVSMVDPDDPYRFCSITGAVTATTTEGAREHIDTLARRYMDEETYPEPIESERVLLRIRADEVFTGP
jgi:PPOX class probable F420-dependent enzyme